MRLRPPSIPAVLFAVLGLFVPIGLQQPLLNSDGDAARHIRHGLYMLDHHALITHDPFSFTRAGAPFLGFEYGSQLLSALAYKAGGLAGVAVAAGLLIATSYALVVYALLRLGVEPLLAYLAAVAAAALGAGHWTARPHLFSFLGVAVLVWLLEIRRPAPAWIFAPLFAVWANLHGGFVFGWMVLGACLAGTLAEALVSQDRAVWLARARYLAAALVCALAGTLATPHGLDLHRHLLAFFGQHYLLDNTAEFLSPDFHAIDGRIYLVGILTAILTLTFVRPRPTLPRLAVILMTLAFGLVSVRNVALFGLTAVPLLALHADASWRRLPDPRGIRARFGRTAASTGTTPWITGTCAAMLALGLNHGRVGGIQLIADRLDPAVFPAAAVTQARSAGLHGRLFSQFAWGGYVLFAWPEQPVFIDGGTDFYGEALFRDYSRIIQVNPGWRERMGAWDLDLLLIKPRSRLAHEVSREPRWRAWYCDSVAVLFRREAARESPPSPDSAEAALRRCSGEPANPDSVAASDPGE